MACLVVDGFSFCILPDEAVETAEFCLCVQECAGIDTDAADFALVMNHPGQLHELFFFFFVITSARFGF